MPSVIQKKSYNSVQVFWLNKILLEEKIFSAVKELTINCPEIQRVILFGSVAKSRETVASDVDILIEVEESKERFIDRPLPFKDFFKEVDLSLDLFVYTQEEIERRNIPLVNTVLREGKVLFDRRNQKVDVRNQKEEVRARRKDG